MLIRRGEIIGIIGEIHEGIIIRCGMKHTNEGKIQGDHVGAHRRQTKTAEYENEIPKSMGENTALFIGIWWGIGHRNRGGSRGGG